MVTSTLRVPRSGRRIACDLVTRLSRRSLVRRRITHHSVDFLNLPFAFFLSAIRVTFVKELPKTATGKIQKYIL